MQLLWECSVVAERMMQQITGPLNQVSERRLHKIVIFCEIHLHIIMDLFCAVTGSHMLSTSRYIIFDHLIPVCHYIKSNTCQLEWDIKMNEFRILPEIHNVIIVVIIMIHWMIFYLNLQFMQAIIYCNEVLDINLDYTVILKECKLITFEFIIHGEYLFGLYIVTTHSSNLWFTILMSLLQMFVEHQRIIWFVTNLCLN